MFKKLICTLLLVALFTCACGKEKLADDMDVITKRGKLIVGVRSDAKPFGYKDITGNLVGYDVDLGKKIAKEIFSTEEAVEFVPVTASNRISMLTTKKVDMLIATLSVTDQRHLVVDFSIPYFMAGQAIMLPAKSDITSLRELNGRQVIIVYGSTGEMSLRMNVPDAKIVGYTDYIEGYKALKAGKADAMLADDTLLYGLAMDDSSVKILPKRYSKEPYAVAFRRGEESDRLKAKVNYLIGLLTRTGELSRMQRKWEIK